MPAVMVRDNESRSMRSGADYHAERLSVARWLSRAVQYRNQTVLKIGEEILRSQRAFFKAGPEHLRPMIMKDIADAVGIHESTVSRVSNAVTIATPYGVMPLKRFFFRRLARAGRQFRVGRGCAQSHPQADPVRNADAAPIVTKAWCNCWIKKACLSRAARLPSIANNLGSRPQQCGAVRRCCHPNSDAGCLAGAGGAAKRNRALGVQRAPPGHGTCFGRGGNDGGAAIPL